MCTILLADYILMSCDYIPTRVVNILRQCVNLCAESDYGIVPIRLICLFA